MSEGESHFHPCPGCSEAVECQLAIGASECGKLRCANCSPSSPPEMENNRANWCGAQSPVGFTCSLPKGHGWHEHIAQNSSKTVVDKWPVSNASVADDDDGEAETCDNCGEDITPENPAMEWNGDSRCKDCYPICSDCEKPIDPDNYTNCHRCEDCLCERHAQYCQCCEEYFCKSHAEGHGI